MAACDVQSRGELPEMVPSSGEHAGPHSLVNRQEANDVLEDGVWQIVYAADAAAHHWWLLALLPCSWSHRFDQTDVAGNKRSGSHKASRYGIAKA